VVEGSLQERAERIAQTTWLGGPPHLFEEIGRMGFSLLLREGLRPNSRVLDVGCGALRLGYWLMRFLEPGCYFGIEPQQDMLAVGLEQIVEPEIVARADAHFDANEDFDFSVFGEPFDFVFARSIWTHASKPQIGAMLSSFAANSTPAGVFLTSYKPASTFALAAQAVPALAPLARTMPLATLSPALAQHLPAVLPGYDYQGETWVGKDNHSKQSGLVRHRFRWIAEEAQRHGLVARQMPYKVMTNQYWLRIAHA
jgi:SAM-dependent methyltransferase